MSKRRYQYIGVQVCLVGRENCLGKPLYNITYNKPKLQVCKDHYNSEAATQYRKFIKEHHDAADPIYASGHYPLRTSSVGNQLSEVNQQTPIQSGESGNSGTGGTGSEISST